MKYIWDLNQLAKPKVHTYTHGYTWTTDTSTNAQDAYRYTCMHKCRSKQGGGGQKIYRAPPTHKQRLFHSLLFAFHYTIHIQLHRHTRAYMKFDGWDIIPRCLEKVSQTLRPRPSCFTAPSICQRKWEELRHSKEEQFIWNSWCTRIETEGTTMALSKERIR